MSRGARQSPVASPDPPPPAVCLQIDVDTVCGGWGVYAIVLSSISMAISLYALLTPKLRLPWGALGIRHASAFLALWWIVGGLLCTFVAPFPVVGNG